MAADREDMGDGERAAVPETEDAVEVRSYFVRGRNALAVRGSFGPLFTDYYLHLMQHGMHPDPEHDAMLKDALAAFTLHLASRPQQESVAWTANFSDLELNLFVTGSSVGESVVGRIFTDDVRTESAENLLYAQISRPDGAAHRSIVPMEGTDFFRIAEQFYAQSEQRPARCFEIAEEDFVLITAQPDCDLEWLANLSHEAIPSLEREEDLSLLEVRRYRFDCGCSLERIYPALAPLSDRDLDDLFAGDDSVRVTCPRCGAIFRVTREMLAELRDDGGP